MTINRFCRPWKCTSENVQQTCQPVITYFHLSPADHIPVLEQLLKLSESHIFQDMWKHSVGSLARRLNTGAGTTSANLDQILQNVWTPVFTRWKTFCQEIDSGNITFDRIDRHFDTFHRQYDLIEQELQMASSNHKLVKDRVVQIQQYHRLSEFTHGAEIMLKLRDSFKLQGDFKLVQDLSHLVSFNIDAIISIECKLFNFYRLQIYHCAL